MLDDVREDVHEKKFYAGQKSDKNDNECVRFRSSNDNGG